MGVAFAEQDPHEHNRGVQTDSYHGESSLTAHQKGMSTSFERHGGAFTTRNVTGGRPISYGSNVRSSLINWDGGGGSPGFQK